MTLLGCSGVDVKTCIEVRAGPARVHRGDVVVYSSGDLQMRAGEVYFFASSQEWEESAFISAWERAPGQASPGCWSFTVLDDLVRVPIHCLRDTVTAHIGREKGNRGLLARVEHILMFADT